MISVIIPAHNEAAVIERTLRALTEGARLGELDVVVVCNGCTDKTAFLAREFGPPVRVVETKVGSKIHALNLGDGTAIGFPRVYLDADVVLPLQVMRRLVERLERGDVLAVAPEPQFDVSGCSWAVRAYYDINGRLPSSREGIGGSGAYAVSAAGRQRFGSFPKLTADDGFVRVQFAPHERETVAGCHSLVRAPRTLADLVRIKTRSHFGTVELKRAYPDLWPNAGPSNAAALRQHLAKPWLWPKMVAYAYVKLAARRRSRKIGRAQGASVWERDESSRR